MDHTSRSFYYFHINLQLKFCVRLQNIFENVELLNYRLGGPCWIQINGFDGFRSKAFVSTWGKILVFPTIKIFLYEFFHTKICFF